MPVRAPRRAASRLVLCAALAIGLVPVLAGCGIIPPMASDPATIVGTGEVNTEVRELAPFTRVSVGAGLKVIVGVAAEQQVTVAAQNNVLPAIRTEVVEGQLIVTIPAPGVTTTQPMSITVRLPILESVALSGGSVGFVEHTGGGIYLDVSGGAEITAIGTTPDLRLVTSSGSHAKLGQLTAQYAEISVKDGSSAEITVVTKVSGTADGGSTVVLTSKPAQVDIEATSGATVQGG
ncbi:MAG TPA: DUF2807 domain-containing protein [Candidatus Limnocylindrales bacterium]|nr:DUF2807 domain-containing protein [Candidatus Limnocylindrales bacterium]